MGDYAIKDDYPFAIAATHSFEANDFYAEISLLAYNLVTWFKRMCLLRRLAVIYSLNDTTPLNESSLRPAFATRTICTNS